MRMKVAYASAANAALSRSYLRGTLSLAIGLLLRRCTCDLSFSLQ
jgi:hypothetical protein